MRRGLALVFVVGCYSAPDAAVPCSISCVDDCPGDLTCTNGFCAGAGDDCSPEFRAVSAGGGYACALDGRDRMWCWGTNARHQIDPSDATGYTTATSIGTATWDSVATGGGHTCAIRSGALACWGANDRGQVSGTVIGDARTPFAITATGAPGTWSVVAAGFETTCGIAGGALYCWGAGDKGVLGNATAVDAPLPAPVMTNVADWSAVAIGFGLDGAKAVHTHACAVSPTAGLWCWGGNEHGELGDGTTTSRDEPVAVALPSQPTSVAVATIATCATTADQRLYCWGNNAAGQLGDPTLVTNAGDIATPMPASLLTGWTKVVAAESMLCAMRADEVWCWGTSASGGLGNGVWSGKGFSRVMTGASDVTVAPNTNIDDSGVDTADLDLACALVGGAIACWGTNQYGQLSQGGATLSPKPIDVGGTRHWSAIAAGSSHACGVADGQLACWGSMVSGQTDGVVAGSAAIPCGSVPGVPCDVSVPTPLSFATNVRALSLGASHTCVLGDTLQCWGDDSVYQLGQPSIGPAHVALPGTWTSLHPMRGNASCATQGTATSCWGPAYNNAQVVAAQPELDGLTTIAISGSVGSSAPQSFGCGLDAAHELYCFGGTNTIGQFGNGNAVGCCAATCGNGACDAGETSITCPLDCGTGLLTRTGRTYTALGVGFGGAGSGGTACGVTPNGQVECWGRNRNSAAGVVDPITVPTVFSATAVANLTGCTDVAVGDNIACALCSGDVWCWGDHRRGAVGSGPVTATPIAVPRKVDVDLAGDAFAQVAVGQGFACARTTAGKLYCWGSNIHGALGNGFTGANVPTQIKR